MNKEVEDQNSSDIARKLLLDITKKCVFQPHLPVEATKQLTKQLTINLKSARRKEYI